MRPEDSNETSWASFPGNLQLSYKKLAILDPEGFPEPGKWRLFRKPLPPEIQKFQVRCREQLKLGDSRAAMVMSLNPLLVAAYTDELDCIAMLRFRNDFVQEYHLALGTRLLTINRYRSGDTPVGDLENGPNATFQYDNFWPFIAEFYSDDLQKIEERKRQIHEDEWRRTQELGERYLKEKPGKFRGGAPRRCGVPAKSISR